MATSPESGRIRACAVPPGSFSIVHTELDFRYAADASVGDASNGHTHLPCRLCNHHIRRDGIDYGTRFHARFAVPTARHPVPGFPVIDRLNGFYSFGLFHAVAVGDVHPQRETMLFRKRKTIHASARHDAAVTSDGFQGHNLIEAIGGVDFQMRCGRL